MHASANTPPPSGPNGGRKKFSASEPHVPIYGYYSRVQHFFWLLSGAEISILKECKTDYNRQAAIGGAIFMTTLLAFFAGTYAGYYFSKSVLGAVFFGLLWAMLVFSIDRTIVVTLKKRPDTNWKAYIGPVLGRAILAVLIAFMISIPLEIMIFQPEIAVQRELDKKKTLIDYRRLGNTAGGLMQDSLLQIKAEQAAAQAIKDQEDCKNDFEYSRLYSAYEVKSSEASKAQAGVNGVVATYERKRANARAEEDRYRRSRLFSDAESYRRSSAYQAPVSRNVQLQKEVASLRADMKVACDSFQAQKHREIIEQKAAAANAGKRIGTTLTNTGKDVIAMDSLIQQSFVRDYIALEHAAYRREPPPSNEHSNPNMAFLLWLIRTIFFLVEILPTLAKVITPFGAYDRAVYQKELALFQHFEDSTARFIEHQEELNDIEHKEEERQAKVRMKIAGEHHDQLLKDIAAAQNEVAKQMIEDYRNKHLRKAGTVT